MKPETCYIQRGIVALTALSLFVGYYLQYTASLLPCPLCLMQRWCMMGVLIVGVLILYRDSKIRRYFQVGFVIAGLFFAVRQVWLQSLPKGMVPACMPGLDILMTYFSVGDVLKALLWGGGDCAKITYRLFGLSLAVWSTFYFIGVALSLWYQVGKKSD